MRSFSSDECDCCSRCDSGDTATILAGSNRSVAVNLLIYLFYGSIDDLINFKISSSKHSHLYTGSCFGSKISDAIYGFNSCHSRRTPPPRTCRIGHSDCS